MTRRKIAQQPPRLGAVSRVEKRRVKFTDAFYKSKEWLHFRNQIVRIRGRVCENVDCRKNCLVKRVFVDHIVEVKDGGELFAPSNVQILCGSCHTKKTLQIRMERSR